MRIRSKHGKDILENKNNITLPMVLLKKLITKLIATESLNPGMARGVTAGIIFAGRGI